MPQTDGLPIKAAGTSFDVVELLVKWGEAGVSEIADELGIAKSAVHDHLKTLERREYVVCEGGRYRLGLLFLSLGGKVRQRSELFRVARTEVRKLADETGECATLMVEENGLGVFLYTPRGENVVTLDAYPGMRVHLHNTAPGRAILAHLPDDRVEAIVERRGLPAITEYTISDRAELDSRLETIRERGYATDVEKEFLKTHCIGMPVRANGEVLGAVSVTGPTSRMRDDDGVVDSIRRALLQTVNVVEVNIENG